MRCIAFTSNSLLSHITLCSISIATAQCKVEPSPLEVVQGKTFQISITVRGSPKPSLHILRNQFAAAWRKVGEYNGPYVQRINLEVAGAKSDESNRYDLGTAVQIVDGETTFHHCIFYLNVTGKPDQRNATYPQIRSLQLALFSDSNKQIRPNCLIDNGNACHSRMVSEYVCMYVCVYVVCTLQVGGIRHFCPSWFSPTMQESHSCRVPAVLLGTPKTEQ